MPTFSEMNAVRSDKGGWMRLEDFCGSAPGGTGLHYTTGIMTADEELLVFELGERVVNTILSWEIDHWDALTDVSYEEYCRNNE